MSFHPPKKSYGGGAGRYVLCKVVNRQDPEQAGRLQVRVFGYQDDEGLIPDQDLIWARPMFPVNNPMDNGVGGPVTGATEGTWFYAMYGDGDQQLQLMHTIGKSGKDDGKGGVDFSKSDTNPHSRDESHQGGDFRYVRQDEGQQGQANGKKDEQERGYFERGNSITRYAKDEAENPFGRRQSKDADENPNNSWSLGYFEY